MNMNVINYNDSYLVTDEIGEIKYITKNSNEKEVLDVLNKENKLESLLKEINNYTIQNKILRNKTHLLTFFHISLTVLLALIAALYSFKQTFSQNSLTFLITIGSVSLAFAPFTYIKAKNNKRKINYNNDKSQENLEEVEALQKEIEKIKKDIKYQEEAFYKTEDILDDPTPLETVNPVENKPKVYKLGSFKRN